MTPRKCVRCLWLTVLLALAAAVPCLAQTPEAGDTLPEFTLDPPESEEDKAYLGVSGPFTLADLGCEYIILEIIGVYCPQCHVQAPGFNALFEKLAKSGLADKVKMLAVAPNGTPMEVAYLRSEGTYKFPVVPDEHETMHKVIGQPKTPFTMVVDAKGKVISAHLGVIKDTDALYDEIKGLVR